jgi:uncharacterized membrane protein
MHKRIRGAKKSKKVDFLDNKRIIYILITLGVIDSIYLTIVHFYSNALACPSTGLINCESVLTSQYSAIFGVPVAILGLILFILAIFMLLKNDDTMKFLWSIAGAGAIVYSLVSQTLLGEVCIYCLALDLIILSLLYITNEKPKQQK